MLMADGTACFDQNYYAEYFHNEQRLFLTFNSVRFLVENISIFYGVVTAMIMNVVSPSGSTEYFYAAKSNPFSLVYRKVMTRNWHLDFNTCSQLVCTKFIRHF